MSDKNIEVLQTHLDHWKRLLAEGICDKTEGEETIEAFQAAIEALKEPCEDADNNYPLNMPTEEYRLRMIRAFHKADCDELIALVVMPTEKEFEQLEGLLKTHYKKQPCEDAVSREAVIVGIRSYWHDEYYQRVPITEEREDLINEVINHLSPVTPKQRMGKWIPITNKNGIRIALRCDACGESPKHAIESDFCPNCGSYNGGDGNVNE